MSFIFVGRSYVLRFSYNSRLKLIHSSNPLFAKKGVIVVDVEGRAFVVNLAIQN
jgi:hypothetical protein